MIIIYIANYNGLVGLRNQMKNAWAQIDVQLKRRHDLIPNLVETVKGICGHERGTLEAVTNARNLAQSVASSAPVWQKGLRRKVNSAAPWPACWR